MHRLWILMLALVGGVASAAPVWVTPKHRAAPPAEMLAGGVLAPVSASDFPVRSRSAMLWVDLAPDGTWQGKLPVDAAGNLRIMSVSTASDDLTLTLDDGSGRAPIRLTPGTRSAIAGTTEVPGIGFFTGYIVPVERSGLWEASITAPPGTRRAGLLVSTDGPAVLRTARETDRTLVGESIAFRASVRTEGAPAPRGMALTMRVSGPDGSRLERSMRVGADGEWLASFTAPKPGRYVVRIEAAGDAFVRTAQHVVDAVMPDVALGDAAAARFLAGNDVLRVEIDAVDLGRIEHCRVGAQLWGTDERGRPVPVCWVGGMTSLRTHESGIATLALELDARWIAHANAAGPFELRRVEVRCPRTMTLLSGADRMPLEVDVEINGIVHPGRILPGMLVAPRNDDLAFAVEVDFAESSRVAGGHNLLLVHGYCADGNPWPVGDFSGAIEVFSDPESNRSHDEFALLLKVLSDTTKSSGVVAHSQGGCAALHLYTYYFSALDWAEGPRLIQSVGTPYQGTPLAGNLAALGDIFGSGCGENVDLSVEGASVWLGGIPSEARARVHYWTTSSSGPWCNFLSGLFLTNPEDGVVEVSRGQLPGGNSMGNTVGQCHTTGMSNPAQYLDPARNSEMNANAAR